MPFLSASTAACVAEVRNAVHVPVELDADQVAYLFRGTTNLLLADNYHSHRHTQATDANFHWTKHICCVNASQYDCHRWFEIIVAGFGKF